MMITNILLIQNVANKFILNLIKILKFHNFECISTFKNVIVLQNKMKYDIC